MHWWKKRSLTDRFIITLLSLMMLYPGIDYLLRSVLPVPVLGSLWDELTLVTLLAVLGLKLMFNPPERSTGITRVMGLVMAAGLALLVLNLTDLKINIEGYRAMFQYMLVFFTAFYLIHKNEDAKLLLTVAVILGTVLAVHGIWQYIVGVPMPGRWVDAGEAVRTRAFSIINSPNALAGQMAFLAPIALGLAASEKTWPKRLLWLAAAGLLVLCLLFTGTRGAWLAFAFALAVIGVIFDRRLLAL